MRNEKLTMQNGPEGTDHGDAGGAGTKPPRVVRVVYVKPRRGGVECPECGEHARVARTMPVDDGWRIRYFKCERCGWTGKTVSEEAEEGAATAPMENGQRTTDN